MTYNYERFSLAHYNLMEFAGPKPGEPIADYELTTLRGETVNLSDFRGRPVVIETGSLTCNLYARNIRRMRRLAERYPEIAFILLYVREAHPGSELHQHNSLDDKRQSAKWLRDDLDERRLILIDDLQGSMHRGLGALPNMIYIIDPDGIVVYRRDWNLVKGLNGVLENLNKCYPDRHTTTLQLNPLSLRANIDLFKTVRRGGWDAIWDLFRESPGFFIQHVKADRHFKRLENTSRPATGDATGEVP